MNSTKQTRRASYRRKPVSSLMIDWPYKMDSGLRRNDGRLGTSVAGVLFFTLLLVACSRDQAQPTPKGNAGGEAPKVTNRIDIPSKVRDNLGITFVKAELRDVANTIRLAGAFELPPQARHEYRLPYAGRVDVLIKQYQPVKAGDELFRLDSPDWRETIKELGSAKARLDLASTNVTMQQQLIAAAKSKVDGLPALLDTHTKRVSALTESETVWAERVRTLESLQGAGGGRASELADAKGELAAARS
ncbi:MAG: hypothetical protein L6Q71_12690, partial [Planctomycetes bacterium]|nr:hypothetical protein [Planctomycetota bacterium]